MGRKPYKVLKGLAASTLAVGAFFALTGPALAADGGSASQNVGGYTFTVAGGGTVNVAKGSENTKNADVVYTGDTQSATSSNTVTLQGPQNLTCTTVDSGGVAPLTLSKNYTGTLTFASGLQIKANGTSGGTLITVNGGTLIANNGSMNGAKGSNNGGTGININGGVVNLNNVNVSGGQSGTSSGTGGVAITMSGGDLNVTGNQITGGNGDTDASGGIGLNQSGGNVTLNGVTMSGGKTASSSGKSGAHAVNITGGKLDVQGGCTLTGTNAVSGSVTGGSAINSTPTRSETNITLGNCSLNSGEPTATTSGTPAIILGGSAKTSLTFGGGANLTSNGTASGGPNSAGSGVLSITNTAPTNVTFASTTGPTFATNANTKTYISAISIGGQAGDVTFTTTTNATVNGVDGATSAATIYDGVTAENVTFEGPGTLAVVPTSGGSGGSINVAGASSSKTGDLVVAEGASVVATSGKEENEAVTFAGSAAAGSSGNVIVNGSLNAPTNSAPPANSALKLTQGDLIVGPEGVLGAASTKTNAAINVAAGNITSSGDVTAIYAGAGTNAITIGGAGELAVNDGGIYALASGVDGASNQAISGNITMENASDPENEGPTLTAIALSGSGQSAAALNSTKTLALIASGTGLETYPWLAQVKNSAQAEGAVPLNGNAGDNGEVSIGATPSKTYPADIFGFYGMANPGSLVIPAATSATGYNSQWVQISPAPIEDIKLEAAQEVATTGTKLPLDTLLTPTVTFRNVEPQPVSPSPALLGFDTTGDVTVTPETNAQISGRNLVFSGGATGDTTTISLPMPEGLSEAYPDLGDTISDDVAMTYKVNFNPGPDGLVYIKPGEGDNAVPTGYPEAFLWTVPGNGQLLWLAPGSDGSINSPLPPAYGANSVLVNAPTALNSQEEDPFSGWCVANAEGGPTGSTITNFDFAQNTNLVAVYAAPPTPEAQEVAVYRLYNPYSAEHLFTTSEAEYAGLIEAGWDDEDIAWNAPEEGTAIYRLYNPYNRDHYYTPNKGEADGLVSKGWVYDFDGQAAFYGASSTEVPVFQLFNPYEQTNTHLWTANTEEYAANQARGWMGEGAKWYALSLPE